MLRTPRAAQTCPASPWQPRVSLAVYLNHSTRKGLLSAVQVFMPTENCTTKQENDRKWKMKIFTHYLCLFHKLKSSIYSFPGNKVIKKKVADWIKKSLREAVWIYLEHNFSHLFLTVTKIILWVVIKSQKYFHKNQKGRVFSWKLVIRFQPYWLWTVLP